LRTWAVALVAVLAGRKLAESEAGLADMVETCSSFVGCRETTNGARSTRVFLKSLRGAKGASPTGGVCARAMGRA
jgi:hypothetical protein